MKSESAARTARSADQAVTQDAHVDAKEALTADLARLQDLLEHGNVEEARDWVRELSSRWPENDAVRHYTHVLAPPRVSVRPGHRGTSRQQERTWLREHAREYPGQWLAVLADRLIAVDPDLNKVLTAVRETSDAQRALLHFQPGTPD
jgi:hypothetical protein